MPFSHLYPIRRWLLGLACLCLAACAEHIPSPALKTQPMSTPSHTNALIHESSPYLLQHAHNPVDWQPWNEAALARAKAEDKMLLISIGYAACHWCHVMEHESFENEAVAEIMNEHFICIKVDREERPDVDDVYMTACQLTSRRGCGWPLNAIALPDGRPMWAGTYYPREQWVNILEQFAMMYSKDRPRLVQAAEHITKGISEDSVIKPPEEAVALDSDSLQQAIKGFEKQIDMQYGGRRGAPKFMMPASIDLLLHYYHLSGDADILAAARVTLDGMARGGLRDQLGGGFARYSVDEKWLVPHFEKMLYDNGQLLSLYSHAYQVTQEPLYAEVIKSTIDWANREMRSPAGGYFASLDADSEGEEGKFYVWRKAEIEAVLDERSALFCAVYDVTENGNWEHNNVLNQVMTYAEAADYAGTTESEVRELLAQCKAELLAKREERVRPGLDAKVLTSWNGLMISGLIDAYKALGTASYLADAERAMAFVVGEQMREDFRLQRNYKDGKSAINAFLDDYATIIQASIDLYEVTFDIQHLERARQMQAYVDQHFYDAEAGLYYYTSDIDPPLVSRRAEKMDNVIPSSNSMTARNLFRLGHYFYDEDYLERSKTLLQNVLPDAVDGRSASFYANWLRLYLLMLQPPYEVAIVGPQSLEVAHDMLRSYLPHTLLLGSTGDENLKLLEYKSVENATMIYVCQNKACRLPTEQVSEALDQIKPKL